MSTHRNPYFPPEHPFSPAEPRAKPVEPPVPIIYERPALEDLSLRVYAAIQLRVPQSGIDWLDEMILKSRELDRRDARAASMKSKRV